MQEVKLAAATKAAKAKSVVFFIVFFFAIIEEIFEKRNLSYEVHMSLCKLLYQISDDAYVTNQVPNITVVPIPVSFKKSRMNRQAFRILLDVTPTIAKVK